MRKAGINVDPRRAADPVHAGEHQLNGRAVLLEDQLHLGRCEARVRHGVLEAQPLELVHVELAAR